MLRIALVDDDADFSASLKANIERHLADAGLEGSVSVFHDAESFRDSLLEEQPHIAFLDIVLPGDNGIKIARALHAANDRVQIVFLTSSSEFAMQGYGVNAVSYLLKPATSEEIHNALDACRQRLAHTAKISVRTEDGSVAIETAAITHMESANRHVHIHSTREEFVHRGKLSDLAKSLPPEFAQVHKSFFVNLDHVSVVKYNTVVLDNGIVIPMSRRFRKEATERFFDRMTPPL